MGVLVENNFAQFVFSNDLPASSKGQSIKNSKLDLETAKIIETALKKNRKIISYSEYDKNKIQNYTVLGSLFDYFFINARKLADKRQKEMFPGEQPNNSLKAVAEKIEKPYPEELLRKGPTARLHKIYAGIEKPQDYSELPPDIEDEWKLLLLGQSSNVLF